MGPDRIAEQPRGLEPGQPAPEITGRGRERFSLSRGLKLGALIFATGFVILEGSMIGAIGPNFNVSEFPKITSGVLEISAVFAIVSGLVLSRYR